MKLNETAVRKLPPPATGYTLFRDDELTGFAVRVTSRGAKSFVLGYTVDGRERRLTIGKYPAWSATAARQRVKELRQQIDRGIDPLEEKTRRREAPTFGDLARQYMDDEGGTKKSAAAIDGMLKRDILPVWGSRKAEDIHRRDVRALVKAKARAKPIAANRIFQLVRALFNWGIQEELVENNPCHKVKPPAEENSRERVLTPDEIATVWHGLNEAAMTPTVAAVLKFTLATVQRARLEWTEINGDWWTIPAEKTKNGKSHRVPLTPLALEILEAQPKRNRWAFPSRYRKLDRPTATGAISTAVHLNEDFGIPHWTPHDLRRSATTHMAKLGVTNFVVGRVLNHSEPGVTKVYNRYEYDAEKRRALEMWERHLRAILDEPVSAKVVEMIR
jgi:integrase